MICLISPAARKIKRLILALIHIYGFESIFSISMEVTALANARDPCPDYTAALNDSMAKYNINYSLISML